MATTTLKVRNGIIKLPKELRRSWQEAEVTLFPSDDTLVVKKRQKPPHKLSEIAGRITLPRMTAKEIAKEIAAYRKGA